MDSRILPLKTSDVAAADPKLTDPVVSSVSISGELSSGDLGTVDELVKKIFNQYSKVKSEFEKLSDSSTTNSDSDWATFDTTVLEPAKIAFDKDKQEIIQLRNKKSSAPQAGDVTVTPPANEDATNTYTKFYELLTSKTSGEYSATLKLPLEFSEYSNYVQANFGEFNTDKADVAGKINTAIETLHQYRKFNDISIETFIKMETGSLNLFFALLFIICMTDKDMDKFKLEKALNNLSLDKIGYIIEELSKQKPNYSFVDIIDTLNKTLFDNNSQLVSVIDPSRHDTPGLRRPPSLAGNNPEDNPENIAGGSSSKSKKSRKSHKSYHPDIGKTRKHHHSHHKKVSFVH